MKRNIHYKIYISLLIFSLVLIGLYFINTDYHWCILSCSIGASLIGAVVLGFILEHSNETNRLLQNRKIFQAANQHIYQTLNQYFICIYDIIQEIYFFNDENFTFNHLNLKQLLQLYINELGSIETFTNETIKILSNDKMVLDNYSDKQQKLFKVLPYHIERLIVYREMFNRYIQDFKTYKHILLANSICTSVQLNKIEFVLNSLQRKDSYYAKLIKQNNIVAVVKNSLKQLLDSKFLDVLDDIGMHNILYNGKDGYLDISIK